MWALYFSVLCNIPLACKVDRIDKIYTLFLYKYVQGLSDIRIRQYEGSSGREWIHFENKFGWLKASYDPSTGAYEIVDYYVWPSHRKRGHGKRFLMTCHQHAISIGAHVLYGDLIVSRESIKAITDLFGAEHVVVKNLGDYTSEGQDHNTVNRTDASFRMPLVKESI